MAKSPLHPGIRNSNQSGPFIGLTPNASKPITKEILEDLINTFLTIPYKPEDPKSRELLERCWHYFKKDYKVGQVQNTSGTLCSHYPSIILIPEDEIANREQENGADEMEEVIIRSSSLSVDTVSDSCLVNRDRTETDGEISEWVKIDHEDGEMTKALISNHENHTSEIATYALPQDPALATCQNGSGDGTKPLQKVS